MKRIIYFLVLGFVCSVWSLPPSLARAQELPVYASPETKPALSTPDYIAMTFFKLTGQSPDFESWARQTDAYKAASRFDQMAVQEQEVQRLKEVYGLWAMQEPLVIEMPVKLSAYSDANHGFFIENFRLDTFFPARYAGMAYAIVPQGIMDKQWLKVEDPAVAAAIDIAARSSADRMLTMVLLLTPRSADKSAPMHMEDGDYWLIAADVKRMMLYAAKGGAPLWKSDDDTLRDQKHQNLLNLYQ